MGSSTSKAARAASKVSSNSTRKYPTRLPPNLANPSAPHSSDAEINPTFQPESRTADEPSYDTSSSPSPLLNARMRQLGPVDPYTPTSTNTSFQPSASSPTQKVFPSSLSQHNPALSLLTARYRLADEAEREFESLGKKGAQGRKFLDVVTLRQILTLRDGMGKSAVDIERELGLERGVVGRLGKRGVVGIPV
ncbi:hypothetical protein B7494_g8589 [Chlorociboria aeruginascens]|nr:hypothetical protein B7494_g8589 [Chlorociboria aeruginascens]